MHDVHLVVCMFVCFRLFACLYIRQDSSDSAWQRVGPSASTLFDWAPQFLQMLKADTLGLRLVDIIVKSFGAGIMITTQYSGIGGPEMAMHSIQTALKAAYGINGLVECWSASDSAPTARKVLMQKACVNPKHVFGDLMFRVPRRLRRQLKERHKRTAKIIHAKSRNGAVPKDVRVQEGERLMRYLQRIMRNAVQGGGRQAAQMRESGWCFKCKKNCRYESPDVPRNVMRLMVAGTPCTSWSRMGSRGQWSSTNSIVFIIWAYWVLLQEPDACIHECTQDFDVEQLRHIFAAKCHLEHINHLFTC